MYICNINTTIVYWGLYWHVLQPLCFPLFIKKCFNSSTQEAFLGGEGSRADRVKPFLCGFAAAMLAQHEGQRGGVCRPGYFRHEARNLKSQIPKPRDHGVVESSRCQQVSGSRLPFCVPNNCFGMEVCTSELP